MLFDSLRPYGGALCLERQSAPPIELTGAQIQTTDELIICRRNGPAARQCHLVP